MWSHHRCLQDSCSASGSVSSWTLRWQAGTCFWRRASWYTSLLVCVSASRRIHTSFEPLQCTGEQWQQWKQHRNVQATVATELEAVQQRQEAMTGTYIPCWFLLAGGGSRAAVESLHRGGKGTKKKVSWLGANYSLQGNFLLNTRLEGISA